MSLTDPQSDCLLIWGIFRHPIKYSLAVDAGNAERRTVRKTLADEFERILPLMIIEAPSRSTDSKLFPETSTTFSSAFYFPRGSPIATVGHPGEQEYRFEGNNAIYLRLFPKYEEGQPKVGRAKLKTLAHDRRLVNAMAGAMGGLSSRNDYGYVVIDPASNDTTRGITQIFPSGEMWGINAQVFYAFQLSFRVMERAVSLGIFSVEKMFARTFQHYTSVAVSEMNLKLPFIVELGAVGLKGVYLAAPHPEFSAGHQYGPIRDEGIIRRYELHDTRRESLHGVLRQFFNELYDLAECSRADLLTDQHISQHDLPGRA
jgi:hypothetical protein